MMKAYKRIGRWLFPLLLMGAAATAAAHFVPRPRGLLERSTRILPIPAAARVPGGMARFFTGYYWLSDHELLMYHIVPNPMGFRWRLSRRDVRTGMELPLTAIMDRVNKPFQFSFLMSVSPDGKHLLWQSNGMSAPGCSCVDLDGSHIVRWNNDLISSGFYAGSDAWQGDSRHLVTLEYNTSKLTPSQIYIRDIEAPKKIQKIPLVSVPEFSLITFRSMPQVTPDNRLTASVMGPNGAFCKIVSVPFGAHAVVRRDHILAPPDTSFFCLPHIGSVRRLAEGNSLSPQGDRRVWLCQSQPYVPKFRALLHRFLPKVNATPRQRVSLWVSRSDGSGMQEVGGVEVDPIPNSAQMPFGRPPLYFIQWLPDGKRLSFVYKETLWTVPVD